MSYECFFESVTGRRPHGYQVRAAAELFNGKNVVVRAPTGAGKTWAVLIPFLCDGWKHPPSRLIYALPLRSLGLGVYPQAREAAGRLGRPVDAQQDERGREIVPPFVTIQTGDQPDDPFLERGKIVVTTYDQLLSGLLGGPYALSHRLHNVNAAAVAGSLIAFDEFHLMESHRAFLTAAACLYLFRGLCQSMWMTATATQPLQDLLCEALDAVTVPASGMEMEELLDSLPSVTTVERRLQVEDDELSADFPATHTGRSCC